MLFNSFTFFIFFVVVLVVTRLTTSWKFRKAFLLVVSYIFYGAWNPPFVLLLLFSTVLDWFTGKFIYKSTNQNTRRFVLGISLLGNLGLLAYFKYGGFVLENLNVLLSAFNVQMHFAEPSIILPVGISFYTFQTLTYTFDIYKRELRPSLSFLDYALYVTFFPQLVAGPILRASDFLPQCVESRVGSGRQIGWGLMMMVIGLFAKVVVADTLMAPVVEAVYDVQAHTGFLSAWAGTLAFAMQIFCDFFGYSTVAIGAGLCLGFQMMDNFRYPYAAIGFSDFWRRWHISLSSWLRDYLYISLGGNRKGVSRTYVNLSLTMLLGGLWHGASWMFVIWGGMHGVYLIAERLIMQTKLAALRFWSTTAGRAALGLLTFVLVNFTWVFFRARTTAQAFAISGDMLNLSEGLATIQRAFSGFPMQQSSILWLGSSTYALTLACTLAVIAIHWMLRESSLEQFFARRSPAVRTVLIAVMLFLFLISMRGEDRAFIYFQF